MHIHVTCPECGTPYQLRDETVGKRFICTNRTCRRTFTVMPAEDGPAQEFDWRVAPPPVQASNGAAARKPIDGVPPATPAQTRSSAPAIESTPRGGRRTVVLLAALVVALIGGGAWIAIRKVTQSEGALRAAADRDYADGSFRAAAKKYDELAARFGRGDRGEEYRFLAELATVRDLATRTPPDPEPALESASAFVQKHARDANLKARRDDLGRAIAAIAAELASQAQAAAQSDLDRAASLVERGRSALGLAERFPSAGFDAPAQAARLEAAAAAISAARNRKSHIDEIVALLKKPSPDLDAARALIRRHRLGDDAAVRSALSEAEQRARNIPYDVLNRPAAATGPPDGPPSLLLEPDAGGAATASGDVVLAVTRGIVFALDGRTGRRLWAARSGLDSSGLPVRVPARGDGGELVLVVSADPPGLTARDVRTGAVRWHQPLDAPLLGRPVLAGARLFATTAGPDGQVYDFDSRDGLLRGRFRAGQALAAGGAFAAATGRFYVPAHGEYVYVFNVAPPAEVAGPAGPAVPVCEGLLPTGHAPGALRGEPIVVSSDDGVDVPRYLVLGETDGLDAMRLRAFRLLDKPTTPGPTADVRLTGWSWFAPYQDSEKLALVTDAGVLGLIGIHQKNNVDPPIFPLLGRDAPPVTTPQAPARAELVHAEENGFWALVGGRLQHWRLGLDRRVGPKLTPAWRSSVALGSPIHASQISRDRKTHFLVTQTDVPAGHWATAVDARTGRLIWQRPLGLTCQGDPAPLGGGVLAMDPSGAAYWFSSNPSAPFTPDGFRVIPPLSEIVGRAQLLSDAAADRAWVLAARPDGNGAIQLAVTAMTGNREQRQRLVTLPAKPAGTAAIGGDALVLPLADGSLGRIPLDGHSQRVIGPNWRGLGARPDTLGHVLHWKDDDFLVSDGGRRIVRLHWSAGGPYAMISDRAIELPARLRGAPVRWPDASAALVADAGGSVHLIRGEQPGIVRSWSFGSAAEPITAGPWVVGGLGLVVVGGKRLVAFEAERETPAWIFQTPGDGILFAPALVDDRLIVADQSGVFLALDRATGRALGPGYRYPAEAASAAAPIGFGPGRFFAPMTDGAALVLAIGDLMGR